MHKAVAVIPARFDSTRLPGKPLALLKGKPLIQLVYEKVSAANLIDSTLVATDDRRIFDAVARFGGKAVMTSPAHESGTDRIAEAAKGIDCDIIVNVQGDEPFIKPQMVDDVVKLLIEDKSTSIGTLSKKTSDLQEILSPNVVKVVTDNEGFALYFSRAPIPYYRDEWKSQSTEQRTQNTETDISSKLRTPNSELRTVYCYKHIGIYGFRKVVLLRFASMKQGRLEMIEKLEQLTNEDLRKAEEWLSLYS
ncbi:MAG: 3-deoxy-manno-octulosonate cytidylyltransferase [Nitrospirae bacterium]|nr:3-deoxy-manno-octulosonate cytidylyltransferase [Nitrospirota bacterium]